MKQTRWSALILAMALSLPALASCSQPEPVASYERPFDALAHRVPNDAEQSFFLDLKPSGETGRHWERIRRQLEAHPTGQQGLDGLFSEFRFEEYSLDESIVRPAVSGYSDGIEYIIAQVSSENGEAVRDALYQHLWDNTTWKQEEYEGQTLYHGRNEHSYLRREWVAWTIYDGLLFLCHEYNQSGQSLVQLKALVGLSQEDSLAALPVWQTLRGRLPETPMGLAFFNIAAQARNRPVASNDDPLGAAFNQQIEAVALAAVPERAGMRIEIVGTVALQDDPPEFGDMFNLPAVDPAVWTSLPSNTAFTLIAHDISVIWPWLKEMFFSPTSRATNWLTQIRDVVGLDLEADLASAEGPLTGDFALVITPPLPAQPIIQGLPAGQLLILGEDASEAQMSDLRAMMESRGAIFGLGTVEGVVLQTQAGTELSGYAISYGFDDDILLFGSSPGVIGQGVIAQREGQGLVTLETFQSFLETLPDDPSLVIYFNSEPMISLNQANMTEEQYQRVDTHHLFEMFKAIGLGLRLAPDRIDGVAYFFVPE